MNENVENIKVDPIQYEADNVEVSFAEIQAAQRLGLIASHSVTSSFEPKKLATRTYIFTVYEEHLVRLLEAELNGKQARTDMDV